MCQPQRPVDSRADARAARPRRPHLPARQTDLVEIDACQRRKTLQTGRRISEPDPSGGAGIIRDHHTSDGRDEAHVGRPSQASSSRKNYSGSLVSAVFH